VSGRTYARFAVTRARARRGSEAKRVGGGGEARLRKRREGRLDQGAQGLLLATQAGAVGGEEGGDDEDRQEQQGIAVRGPATASWKPTMARPMRARKRKAPRVSGWRRNWTSQLGAAGDAGEAGLADRPGAGAPGAGAPGLAGEGEAVGGRLELVAGLGREGGTLVAQADVGAIEEAGDDLVGGDREREGEVVRGAAAGEGALGRHGVGSVVQVG
jgi:hypothetical protein